MGTKGKPNNATIRKVVEYLAEELGLSVYGQCTHFDDEGWAYEYPSNGDFDADDIIKLRKAYRLGHVVDMTTEDVGG